MVFNTLLKHEIMYNTNTENINQSYIGKFLKINVRHKLKDINCRKHLKYSERIQNILNGTLKVLAKV